MTRVTSKKEGKVTMNPQLTWSVARARQAEASRISQHAGVGSPEPTVGAAHRWRDLFRTKDAAPRPQRQDARSGGGVTVRYAFPDDAEAVARLAVLDSQPLPEGPMLVAEVEGELWAALSLSTPAAMADPFRPSAELLLLLAERSRQLRGPARRRSSRGVTSAGAPRWRTS